MATDGAFRQATLGVTLPEQVDFERFWVGENASVVQHLQTMLSDPIDSYCFCWGNRGAGKTHLLKASCYLAAARGLTQVLISLSQANIYSVSLLQGLEAVDVVCIDDIDAVAGDSKWEEALFHYYNRFLDSASRLIIASALPPKQLPLQLADLRSRLSAGSVYHVKALSETDKRNALQQQAKARGLKCPSSVAEFILTRCGRDMTSLVAVVERLDAASLAAGRPLTIPFVKSVLGV